MTHPSCSLSPGGRCCHGSTRLRPPDTIYSAPVLATIGGHKLLIAGASDGWMYALQPRTGKFVWEYQLSRRGLNVSPTVDGDVVYTGHSEENLSGRKVGAVVAVNAAGMGNITQNGEIWKELEIADGFEHSLPCTPRPRNGSADSGTGAPHQSP